MAVSRWALFALTGSLAALASVIQAGTVSPVTAATEKCPASPAPPPAPPAAAAAQASASPVASGTIAAETATQPITVLTVSGKDQLAAAPAACPTSPPPVNGQKITKSRSNIQNN